MRPGDEVGLRIDQTLTQDATGTLVMLELEAMGLDRVRTELSVQYVDHNLIQADNKNPDDHRFLRSACQRFGLWYSGPGNGVSHPCHQENFGKPGKALLGSDSHTPAAALGMLAIGAGGLEVALAMAGEPFFANLLHAGARLHQADYNGCIGMGQAPATHALSLRTVPRNFPGRSGTREDKVCLVSSEPRRRPRFLARFAKRKTGPGEATAHPTGRLVVILRREMLVRSATAPCR